MDPHVEGVDPMEGQPQGRRMTTSELLARQMEMLANLLQQQQATQQMLVVAQQQQQVPAGRPRIQAHPPPTYDGKERNNPIKRWIIAMEQYFRITQLAEELKVGFAANALREAAQSWWLTLEKDRMNPDGSMRPLNWNEFSDAITQHFNPVGSEVAARTRLWNVKQTRSVRDYIREFQEVMVEITDATEAELKDRFAHNLKDHIKREVMQAQPTTLAETFRVAELHDQISWQLRGSSQNRRARPQSNPSGPTSEGPAPMELGKRQAGTKTNKQDKNKEQKTCFNCGKKGHFAAECRSKPRGSQPSPQQNSAQVEEEESETESEYTESENEEAQP